MNSKLIIRTLSLAAVVTSGLAYKVQADVQTDTSSASVYRVYNTNTGEHFYTTSNYEKNSLIMAGWDYEGTGWQSPTKGKAIYRLYNPNAKGGDHYYTQSIYELKNLVQKGWKQDNQGQPVFYSGGKVNNYVAYNPNAYSGSHNYTTSQYEQGSLLKQGWKYGKVAWTVTAPGQSVTPMNLEQLAKGDYSSVQGTWKNAKGEIITIRGNKVTGDVDVAGQGIKEVSLHKSYLMSNFVYTLAEPQLLYNTRMFLFASGKVKPYNVRDATDQKRDRILLGKHGGADYFNQSANAFYRIN